MKKMYNEVTINPANANGIICNHEHSLPTCQGYHMRPSNIFGQRLRLNKHSNTKFCTAIDGYLVCMPSKLFLEIFICCCTFA